MIAQPGRPACRSVTVLFLAIALLIGGSAMAPATFAQPAADGAVTEARSLPDVLEEVTPTVVNIAVTSRVRQQTNPLYNDPFFRRFFNLPDMPQPRTRMSAGSGVIVDAQAGYILTNAHVVADATEIAVTLKDRRRFTAELVGSDRGTDIALLKIEAEDLSALDFADSDTLRVGETVYAIGNPFGLGQTVTSGIISALGRSGISVEGYEDFIQTDASINPGNSGGALINADGRLVGINTAIITPGGGNVGIGFAVPINMASAVMSQLAEHGEVRRGRIGVAIQDLTPDLAEALGIAESFGAVVSSVEEGSPASAAGLQAGDVVLAVDGRPVSGSSDLRNRVGLAPLGSTVEIRLWRDGEEANVSVRIEAPGEAARHDMRATPERLAGARFEDTSQGVVVAAVEPGSPAAQAGLRQNDVILAVNRRPVTSVAELNEALAATAGTIALDLIRDGARFFLVIR
ncbi:MAG: DegQ family serine endoprotease [Salinarimonadaceae bacterium]|nr:MAG: DegQ family serine endoprotease [Salinarimonadaceae bacterium]